MKTYLENDNIKSNEIIQELEKTCPRNEDSIIQVPSMDYILQIAEKLGWRRVPPISPGTNTQNEIPHKEKLGE
jgi:hypothetical protein